MKREEERIRKLFQQLKAEDERHAPSFAQDWNAALSRQEKLKHQWSAWRVVAGAALLIVLGAGWWMYVSQSTKQPDPVEIVSADRPVDSFTPREVSPAPAPVKNPPSVTRRQRTSVRRQPTAIWISQWRSPTQSLLHTPGEQLLKRVPRLDESLVNIKVIIPN
jgi:hypothetical protein